MKIFISYSKEDKKVAGELKICFEHYKDIECFIAHDDIKQGTDWEEEILNNLSVANYFLPLQTENLVKSYWCQQEAGIAFNRKIKITPLISDVDGIDPVGFYAKYQGFKIKTGDLNSSVKRFLIKEGVVAEENFEEIEKRMLILAASNTRAEADANSQLLLELEDNFSEADVIKVVEIVLSNEQIFGSYAARFRLKKFFTKHANIISGEQLKEFLSYE